MGNHHQTHFVKETHTLRNIDSQLHYVILAANSVLWAQQQIPQRVQNRAGISNNSNNIDWVRHSTVNEGGAGPGVGWKVVGQKACPVRDLPTEYLEDKNHEVSTVFMTEIGMSGKWSCTHLITVDCYCTCYFCQGGCVFTSLHSPSAFLVWFYCHVF